MADDAPATKGPYTIRDATPEDATGVAAIYADAVLHGLGTFDEVPPSVEETGRRMAAIADLGLPWLVAADPEAADSALLGFAYASAFRPRAAYRYTVEDSVYVAAEAKGRGAGRALLGQIIGRCEALGMRQMLAIIGDSGNAASIRLHAALGFERAGLLSSVGFKHGQWVDVVCMRRGLNGGAADPPPAGPGLKLGGG